MEMRFDSCKTINTEFSLLIVLTNLGAWHSTAAAAIGIRFTEYEVQAHCTLQVITRTSLLSKYVVSLQYIYMG